MLHKISNQTELGPVRMCKERYKKEHNVHIVEFLWNQTSELVVITLGIISLRSFTFANLYNYFLNAEKFWHLQQRIGITSEVR